MTYGYIRVSSDKQTVENQRFEITRFLEKQNMQVDGWIEETVSGTKEYTKRELGQLLEDVKKDDLIICAELSRLGRSLFMVMEILSICMKKECQVWTIKDNYRLGDDMTSKVLAFAFGLSAEIERNLISQRTTEALKRLKAEGKKLGRPVGRKSSKVKLTGHEDEVRGYLEERIAQVDIAGKFGVDRMTLAKFIKDNNLAEGLDISHPVYTKKQTRLEGKDEEIKAKLMDGASRYNIAREMKVSEYTLNDYIKNHDLADGIDAKFIRQEKHFEEIGLTGKEEYIKSRFLEGATQGTLITELGVSREALKCFINEKHIMDGLDLSGVEKQRKYKESKLAGHEEYIRAMLDCGKSAREIAERFGVTTPTASQYISTHHLRGKKNNEV